MRELGFRRWLEDTGEVSATTNDRSYAERGIGSKWVATDKVKPERISKKIDRLFGKGSTARTYRRF